MDKESKLLKPCPFCGGENIVMRDVSGIFGKSAYTRTYHYLQCRDCMSQTGFHGTKPKTIEAWNRRKPMDNIVEQLDELDIEDVYDYTEKKYFEYVALHEVIEIVKGGGNNG